MEVITAIKARRSIRKYQATPVAEETVAMVLEAARWAPSWGNTQCWRFIVVRDNEIKRQLADTLIDEPTLGYNPATNAIMEAPVVIVACARRQQSGYFEGQPATEKGDWYLFDTGLAMQNLVLAACSLGLGTVHVGATNGPEVARILGVPDDMAVVEMTPLGYPNQEPRPRPRRELDEIVFYERYGQNQQAI